METCLNCFKEAMKLKEVEAREYSPLALAIWGMPFMSWQSGPLS